MIQEHPSFPWPKEKGIKIWRYMNFSKFANLLFKNSLFFPKGKLLEDPFEGSKTKPDFEMREYILKNKEKDPQLSGWKEIPDSAIEKVFETHKNISKIMRDECFISCWHANEHESAAMWKIYSENDESICIQTTFSRVLKQFPDYVFGGLVNYIDYEKDIIKGGNLFSPLMHKRKSFEHEKELRFIITGQLFDFVPPKKEIKKLITGSGLNLPINPSKFIEAVFISPTAPDWFFETVAQIVKISGHNIPINQSSLTAEPLF